MWASLAAAVSDLRVLVSDGPTDKLCSQKNVFGKKDSVNTLFKTFERRRVTSLVGAVLPFGVFKNGTLVTVSTDFADSGDFVLAVAPANTDTLVASYYHQWWTDAELQLFLKNASQWMGLGSDPTTIPDGLQPAALHYAGQEAYSKLALWWSLRISETYKVEDRPSKSLIEAQKSFLDMAKEFRSKSAELRKQFYTRQDQAEAPLFGINAGAVRDQVPRR